MFVLLKRVLVRLVYVCVDAPSEGDIRYRLRNLDLDAVQETLNDKLKINVVRTVFRKSQTFTIDFVNIPYYGEEKQRRHH